MEQVMERCCSDWVGKQNKTQMAQVDRYQRMCWKRQTDRQTDFSKKKVEIKGETSKARKIQQGERTRKEKKEKERAREAMC